MCNITGKRFNGVLVTINETFTRNILFRYPNYANQKALATFVGLPSDNAAFRQFCQKAIKRQDPGKDLEPNVIKKNDNLVICHDISGVISGARSFSGADLIIVTGNSDVCSY